MKNYGKLFLDLFKEGKAQSLQIDEKKKLQYLQHEEDGFLFQSRFKEVEKFAVVVDYLSVSQTTPILDVELINKRLEAQAEAIQKNVTFLLEDFKLIEIDRQNKRAQLRSYPPHTEENSKYYYEIVLDEGTRAHFQRYAYSMTEKRYEKITSQLTTEVFERLVNELVRALQQ